jgi:PBP1b-binding outer membrane lipoprotein LpoB
MKKILILLLSVAFLWVGCAEKETKQKSEEKPEISKVVEPMTEEDDTGSIDDDYNLPEDEE